MTMTFPTRALRFIVALAAMAGAVFPNMADDNFEKLRAIALGSLPPPIGYWPLSEQFGLRGLSPTNIDATFTGSGWNQVLGPFGTKNGAFRTSKMSSYLNWSSNFVDLGAKSWTLSTYVNLNGATDILPIFEWYKPNSSLAHIFQYNATNRLYFNPLFGPSHGVHMPCRFGSAWEFLAVSYDNPKNTWWQYCDNQLGGSDNSIPSAPLTSSVLMGGYRSYPTVITASNSYACVSIFSGSLTAAQLNLVKQLCPLFEAIECSSNCMTNTCRPSLNSTKGYTCGSACLSGWSGDDCTTPVCGTPCMGNKICSSPNSCTCKSGWAGSTCTTCTLQCKNGGTCIGPNVCKCKNGWTGATCETAMCSPACANGGTCTSPNVCCCALGWTGNSSGCDTQTGTGVRQILKTLPSLVAYWPLTEKLRTLDITSDPTNSTGSTLTAVSGPFGGSDTAFQTGANAASYVMFQGRKLNFKNNPWTLSAYVKGGASTPFFEYHVTTPSIKRGANMWSYPSSDQLWVNTFTGIGGFYTPCPMSLNWQFVAVVHDIANQVLNVFCDKSFSHGTVTITVPSATSDSLYMGHSEDPDFQMTGDASFTCASVYSSALDSNQLLNVKELCRFYHDLVCSSNCVAGSCFPNATVPAGYTCTCTDDAQYEGPSCDIPVCVSPCQHGGTCTAPRNCTCTAEWEGSTCETPKSLIDKHTQRLLMNLTTIVAYWPLTSNLRARDLTANRIDGVESAALTPVTGPSDIPGTGLETIASPRTSYLTLKSPLLNFSASSWTLTMFVKTGNTVSPLFEYQPATATGCGAMVWQYESVNNLCTNIGMPVLGTINPCTMNDRWQFVGIAYDSAAGILKTFCNNTFLPIVWSNLTSPPITTDKLYIGHRDHCAIDLQAFTGTVKFACASAHSSVLDVSEMLAVKQLCPLLQGEIKCWPNCQAGTCHINITAPTRFGCTCSSGWTGPTCETQIPTLALDIPTILNNLPPLVAFWPLTCDCQLHDVTSNHIDGVATSQLTAVAGPLMRENTALQTTATAPERYARFSSPKLDFGNSSWTLTTFVNLGNDSMAPIFEYRANTTLRAHMWQLGGVNKFFVNGMPGGVNNDKSVISIICPMRNVWQFVGMAYDHANHLLKAICNDSYSTTTVGSPPMTGSVLLMGRRLSFDPEKTAEAGFACASVFNAVLTVSDLTLVKQLCPLFQAINCSSNCEPTTTAVQTSAADLTTTASVGSSTPVSSTASRLTASGMEVANTTEAATHIGTLPNEFPNVTATKSTRPGVTSVSALTLTTMAPAGNPVPDDGDLLAQLQYSPSLGKADSSTTMTAKRLASECTDVNPFNRSPPPYQGIPIQGLVKFSIDRFLGISDVNQSIAVSGQLYTRWSVVTCKSATTGADVNSTERIMVTNIDEIWHPAISFQNSVDDISMKKNQFYDRMEIVLQPNSEIRRDRDHRDIFFYWKKRGIFNAACTLDLENYPFDTQTCSLKFTMVESAQLIEFAKPQFAIAPLKQPRQSLTDQWTIVEGWANISVTESLVRGEGLMSQATFTLIIKRHADYCLYNLISPCFVLTLLCCSSFFIPPNCSERVCFNVYVLLAIVVSLSQVLDKIPKTSQNSLLNSYIEMLALVCLFVTVHSIFMLRLTSRHSETISKLTFCKIQLKCVIDICGYLIGILLLMFASLYAGSVAFF